MNLRKTFFIFLILCAVLSCRTQAAWANNLSIYNVKTSLVTSGTAYVSVTFNLSWANSWKDATNYDAAWVFIKYSTDSGASWNHATLHSSVSATTTLGTATKGSGNTGCFFYRSANATGTYSATVMLPWNYIADAVDTDMVLSRTFSVKVIGIEMVEIPTANFYIGEYDGADCYASDSFIDSDTNLCALISTAANANISNNCAETNTLDDTYNAGSTLTIDGDAPSIASTLGDSNTGFPTGYAEFYLMKYEITEGLWVTFFNTLTDAQKANRDITGVNGKNSDATIYRNTISWTGSGAATTSRPDRAMHYLSWMDLCAIADWAALRPMTELEYEKAAYGTATPTPGYYAWQATGSAITASTISGTENGTETISTASANHSGRWATTALSGGDGGVGPLRVGIFATGSSTRALSGAGFYGNMELTGNVAEYAVSVGNPQGRAYDGTPGDGVLTTTSGYEGNATNTDWPGIDATTARGVTGYLGSGIKGGKVATYVSDRAECPSNTSTRAVGNGGRLARTS